MISIIIPTFNEERPIFRCLESIYEQNENYEIIAVDGGSTDKTPDVLIGQKRVLALRSEKGRPIQLNAGARKAQGDVLLFLHADTILPPDALSQIVKKINEGFIGGGFFHQYNDSRFSLQLVAFRANMRAKLFKVFFGDQAIFVKRDVFFRMEGFRDIPIMEDLEFCKRLKGIGKLAVIESKITVSARNYIQKGVIRLTWIYFRLMLMYHFGKRFDDIKKKFDKWTNRR